MIYSAKVHLCNGEVAEVEVDTDDINEWADEVMDKGIISDDTYIPVSSITYIKFHETAVDTLDEIEVEFEQEN